MVGQALTIVCDLHNQIVGPGERMSRRLLKFGDGPGASYAAVVTVTSST
jgi:hypothetical protein